MAVRLWVSEHRCVLGLSSGNKDLGHSEQASDDPQMRYGLQPRNEMNCKGMSKYCTCTLPCKSLFTFLYHFQIFSIPFLWVYSNACWFRLGQRLIPSAWLTPSQLSCWRTYLSTAFSCLCCCKTLRLWRTNMSWSPDRPVLESRCTCRPSPRGGL